MRPDRPIPRAASVRYRGSRRDESRRLRHRSTWSVRLERLRQVVDRRHRALSQREGFEPVSYDHVKRVIRVSPFLLPEASLDETAALVGHPGRRLVDSRGRSLDWLGEVRSSSLLLDDDGSSLNILLTTLQSLVELLSRTPTRARGRGPGWCSAGWVRRRTWSGPWGARASRPAPSRPGARA